MSDAKGHTVALSSRPRRKQVAVRTTRKRKGRATPKIYPTKHVRSIRPASRPSSYRSNLRTVAYNDTRLANQPSHVPTDDQEPLLTRPREVRFPISFNLYCLSFLHGRYYLGLHKKTPMYRIRISWPKVALYNGLKTDDPLLGTFVHRRNMWKKKRRPRDQVFLPSGVLDLEDKSRFTVDVPSPGEAAGTKRREVFEWRPTRGPSVRLLGRHTGLKLVRLATDVVRGPSAPAASGGGEAVAVLVFYGVRWRKTAAFRFQGSGAQGVLGRDWETAAVMTAIGLWDKHERE